MMSYQGDDAIDGREGDQGGYTVVNWGISTATLVAEVGNGGLKPPCPKVIRQLCNRAIGGNGVGPLRRASGIPKSKNGDVCFAKRIFDFGFTIEKGRPIDMRKS